MTERETNTESIEKIKEERDHVIQLINADDPLRSAENSNDSLEEQNTVSGSFVNSYIPIEATAEAGDHFWDHRRYLQEDIKKVRHIAQREGLPEVKVIEILKMAQQTNLKVGEDSNIKPDSVIYDSIPTTEREGRTSKNDRKKHKRDQIYKLSLKLAGIVKKEPREIHKFWQDSLGGKTHEESNENDLDKKLYWVKECLKAKKLVLMR